jgi:integrase
MATKLNRTGTVLKKCDRSNHKPETNKRCTNGTCQHTCDNPEKCKHAWTLRYSVNGKQLEKSFRDQVHATTGRTLYGSGRKLAEDWQLTTTVQKRSGDVVFADHGKSGKQNFGEACEQFIARMAVSDSSKGTYSSTYRQHVKPVFGDKTISQVANDLDGVTDLLTVTMKDLSDPVRQQARMVIVGTCDYAVKSGKLSKHRLSDIELVTTGTKKHAAGFVFPTHAQVKIVADGVVNQEDKRLSLQGAGICVWLMRGCGLRIEEALAVRKEDFKGDGSYLRVMWQASRDGRSKLPLKHRKQGEYRDVPVPSWLWDIVKDMPEGPLMPGNDGKPYPVYQTIRRRFMRAAEAAGIPEDFTPHSLRHAFASVLLGKGVPLGDVSEWLGHKDVNTTYKTYRHMMPDAPLRAVAALDAEFAEWSGEAA